MSRVDKIVIGAAIAWSVGIFVWQRSQGVITLAGGTIPGFLDPLGSIFGYPNAVQVSIGDPIEVNS